MNVEEIVGLSEREQKLLEEMERGLYASEADSLRTRSGNKNRPSYRAILVATLGLIAGVIALIAAVATGYVWLGVVGFAIMLGGVLFAFSPKNQVKIDENVTSQGSESLAEKAQKRWEQRMDGER